MTPKFACLIFNGEIEKIQSGYKEYLRSLKDGWYILTVKKPESKRTGQMNRYLWGVVYKLISDETGYEPEQVHMLMKVNFGLLDEDYVSSISGLKPEFPKSTTKYTIEEMQEYWRKIAQWAAEFLNLQIPEPNEVEL